MGSVPAAYRVHSRFSDIEARQEAVKALSMETVQLEPGRICLESDRMEAGDLLLAEFRTNRRILDRCELPAGTVLFQVPSHPRVIEGREIPSGVLTLALSGAYDPVSTPGGWSSLELYLPESVCIAEDLVPEDWLERRRPPGSFVWPLASRERSWLANASHLLREGGDEEISDACVVAALREAIVAAFRRMVGGPTAECGAELSSRQKTVLAEALRHIDEAPSEPLEVERLAHDLDVSARALRLLFEKAVGVGPYRYALRVKLHAVRSDLKRGDPQDSVALTARRYGFRSLGRFAEQYRSLFAENPRDTLLRSRVA